MFLKMLSEESQKVFLQTCVLAAKANGTVVEEEQAMMSEYCHEMGLAEQISWVDGVCIYLNGNLCSIYETRPLLCRIDESYDAFFSKLMDKETYYTLNIEECKKLKETEE